MHYSPRQIQNLRLSVLSLNWGFIFPVYTNLLVIAMCYAAVAPLVLGFAGLGLSLSYIAYRFKLFFAAEGDADTMGKAYFNALQQLFVGLYLSEVCLIGLFAVGLGM